MKLKYFSYFFSMATTFSPTLGIAQVQLTESLMLWTSPLKPGVSETTIRSHFKELNKNSGAGTYSLFKADRGTHKGEFLISQGEEVKDKSFRPFADLLQSPSAFTEYKLIGATKIPSLPKAGIFGIHYLKIKKDQAIAFEKFVEEKLNPALSRLLPDMQMLYYKGTDGQQKGSYITIFTIASTAARDQYWPEGSETEKLKETFRPLKNLALELSNFLVEGSYLKPESGGAAAYFESLDWTDYVLQQL